MEENHSLAYELLEEVKRSNDKLEKSNKRWFIIALVELIIIVSMIVGYFVYQSQYEYTDEIYTQETHEIDNSTVNQSIE